MERMSDEAFAAMCECVERTDGRCDRSCSALGPCFIDGTPTGGDAFVLFRAEREHVTTLEAALSERDVAGCDDCPHVAENERLREVETQLRLLVGPGMTVIPTFWWTDPPKGAIADVMSVLVPLRAALTPRAEVREKRRECTDACPRAVETCTAYGSEGCTSSRTLTKGTE